jgi:tRNA(Arg) A34 adenosine deaminase TadA
MEEALKQAQAAFDAGEVPVGAVMIHRHSGQCIAATHNRVERDCDPTAHAEMLAIRMACSHLQTTHLEEYDLYVTLEPCAMCAQAISHARIGRLYFGAWDVKSGGTDHGARIFHHATCHHKPEVYGGIMAGECERLLKAFFVVRR